MINSSNEHLLERRITQMVEFARRSETVLSVSSEELFVQIEEAICGKNGSLIDVEERTKALFARLQKEQMSEIIAPTIRDPDALFARIGAEIAGYEDDSTLFERRSEQLLAVARKYQPSIPDPEALFERISVEIAEYENSSTFIEHRSEQLLAVAREYQPLIEDPEALFAQITDRITDGSVEKRLSDLISTTRQMPDKDWQEMTSDSAANDNNELSQLIDGRNRWRRSTFFTAAAAVAILLWTIWRPTPILEPIPLVESTQLAEQTLETSLTPTPTAVAAVEVFASDNAAWSLLETSENETNSYVLRLHRGALLVEFVPIDGATLQVETQNSVVHVVGTAFYVDTEQETVSVVTGAVRVERNEQIFELKTNEVLTENDEIVEISDDSRESLTFLVDPILHQQRLDEAAQAANFSDEIRLEAQEIEEIPQPVRTEISRENADPEVREHSTSRTRERSTSRSRERSTPRSRERSTPREDSTTQEIASPEVENRTETEGESLRQTARRALAEENWELSVETYETLLRQTNSQSSLAATIRLELARIYINHLDRPMDAERHMARFLRYNSDDVAVSAVREAYCERLRQRGTVSRHCNLQ